MIDAHAGAAVLSHAPSLSPNSSLLTISDVQAELKCSRAFIYTLIDAGKLRPIKLGRAVRIRSSEVREIVENGASL